MPFGRFGGGAPLGGNGGKGIPRPIGGGIMPGPGRPPGAPYGGGRPAHQCQSGEGIPIVSDLPPGKPPIGGGKPGAAGVCIIGFASPAAA